MLHASAGAGDFIVTNQFAAPHAALVGGHHVTQRRSSDRIVGVRLVRLSASAAFLIASRLGWIGVEKSAGGDAGGASASAGADADYGQVMGIVLHRRLLDVEFSPMRSCHRRCRRISIVVDAQAAQHDSCLTSLLKVCAASFNPSTIVR